MSPNECLLFDPQLQTLVDELHQHVKALEDEMLRCCEKVADGFLQFKSAFPSDLRVLADNGWFLSFNHTPLSGLRQLANLFRSGAQDAAHEEMCLHFDDIIDNISSDLVAAHPDRASILSTAFQAHQESSFELSVPVFLIQADGILDRVFGTSVYTRIPKKRKLIEDAIMRINPQSIEIPIFRLVVGDLPLTTSTHAPDYTTDTLSRHAIIHGIDVSYGTRRNSFRALSWLQFASHLAR